MLSICGVGQCCQCFGELCVKCICICVKCASVWLSCVSNASHASLRGKPGMWLLTRGGYLCEEFTQQMFGRKPWHKSCWSRIWIEILSNWHWTQSKKQQSRVFWTIANKFQTNCEHKSNQLRAQLWAMHETALLLSTISPFPNNLLWEAVKIPPRR